MYPERGERRRGERDSMSRSLGDWLGAVADRTRSLAFVLADRHGMVVASSVDGPEAEELAALAPLLVRGLVGELDLMGWELLGLRVDQVEIDGEHLLLCAVGDEQASDATVSHAAAGVRRILTN